MKKKSKDQRWRWICAGSLLLASLSGNLEASGLSHPDVNPMEVSQTVRKLRGTSWIRMELRLSVRVFP